MTARDWTLFTAGKRWFRVAVGKGEIDATPMNVPPSRSDRGVFAGVVVVDGKAMDLVFHCNPRLNTLGSMLKVEAPGGRETKGEVLAGLVQKHINP